MVLRGQNGVFHARRFRLTRPFARIEQIGIEMLEVFVVFFLGNALAGLDPFVARGHRIKPPVNEHSKAVAGEPCGVAGRFAGYIAGH